MEMQHENDIAAAAATDIEAISNQETETAAIIMKSDEENSSVNDPSIKGLTATTTTTITTKSMRLEDLMATFAMPALPPPPKLCLNTKSANSSRSSSLKKKQRRCLTGAEVGGETTAEDGGGGSRRPTNSNGSGGGQYIDMKTSQSMTSLQPNEEQQESRDVIQAKLHLERPYNSLKKNNTNKMHRYSWGSGHSHSSSNSLHSNATLGLSSSGKDDLWAAIQTNYNYIMDTNLLDTCKEARCEIEGAATVLEKSNECCFKILDETQRPEGLCEDPKELRRWLRDMENKLENSPTISELTLYGNAELQRHLAVHSVLYHEIVSHARVVSSCIRAASEREQQQQQQQLLNQQQQQLQQQQPASLTSNCSSDSTNSESVTKSNSLSSGFASSDANLLTTAAGGATTATTTTITATPSVHHPKKGEGNLERLRDRYHLLYLKAFELQLCLDNLLRKRSSTGNGLDDDDDDEDDDDDDDDDEDEDTEDDSYGYEGEDVNDGATEDDLIDHHSDLDLDNDINIIIHKNPLTKKQLQRCQVVTTEIVVQQDSQKSHQTFEEHHHHHQTASGGDCIKTQKPGDEADEEEEEETEADEADVVDFVIAKRCWRPTLKSSNLQPVATLTDFEADSESSDLEQIQEQLRRNYYNPRYRPYIPSNSSINNTVDIIMSQANSSGSTSHLQQHHHHHHHHSMLQMRNKMLPPSVGGVAGGPGNCSTKSKSIAVAVITPNSHGNGNANSNNANGSNSTYHNDLTKSPSVLRKSRHHNDTSKFNRSNRKSKNCAIFYFKHLDTDNETASGAGTDHNGEVDIQLDHQHHQHHHHHNNHHPQLVGASDILKSADASTDDDDEGWLYTATATTATGTATTAVTTIVDGLQSTDISSTTTTSSSGVKTSISDDSDKENKEATLVTTTTTTSSSSNYDSSSACSSSNSNGVHTETSATSRVTQMQRNVAVVGACDMDDHDNNNMQMLQCKINGNASSSSSSNEARHIISNNCYKNNNNNNCNHPKMGVDLENIDEATVDMANGNAQQQQTTNFYSRADICNISVWPTETTTAINGNNTNGNRLPPRSPAKSTKSQASSSNATMSAACISPVKGKVSHDSIKQLVLKAEHLVRDAQEAAAALMKTPTKQKHSIVKISSTVKKREVNMPGPIKQRVEEWLEHQPSTPQLLTRSHTHELLSGGGKPDDCEASGEASETDSIPQTNNAIGVGGPGPVGGAGGGGAGSDTSEGFTDSIATCMQTSTNSYGNSTERIGGSAEPIGQPITPLGFGSSNQSLNVKIVKRPQARRKSERPWSVSCLSQLTTDAAQLTTTIVESSPPGLASHSISESALDSLSPGPRPRAASSSGTGSNAARKADSKGSLRRRKARKKRMSAASAGRKSDSGSEVAVGDLTQTLMKSCESMSSQQLQEFTNALLSIQKGSSGGSPKLDKNADDPENESQLMLPNFRVGSFTTAALMASESRLGALAALSNYMNEDEQQAELSTEEHHSSISETAWDNYQEKYNSENYSEGFDSDAARRLLEFGDDYRNFIDSQSDCCSSLSAANNLDSFSPPRMDSLQKHELKALHINQETISSSVDHARRQRALELQYERRRKTLEVRRKSCQDMDESLNEQKDHQQGHHAGGGGQSSLSASATALMTPKNMQQNTQLPPQRTESVGRKLEFGGGMSHSAQSLLRRTSESDTSTRRRRTVTADERRRSSRNLEKCIKLIPATSSSSGDDSEDGEQEMRSLLQQSRDRLEDTRALKIRCHLLRPEDYNEIINTCRDNIRCLEAVLRGPPGTVLSTHCAGQTKGESQPRSSSASARTKTSKNSVCNDHQQLIVQLAPECKCAPITRFVARIIDFVTDVSNLLEHFTLYRFLMGTLRSFYALVNRPLGRLERLFASFRGLL
ncbi:uncharacterized protein Dwil_GK20119 [Drosophila willistoni]|uniref:KASH domain-containing protein n=1 Tax=Drosophila willistoni TaxID=7260 RepID=B4MXG4_DROWI|nr:uncharacterized protein Dwil_GK20119 [Drosophila willistoni]